MNKFRYTKSILFDLRRGVLSDMADSKQRKQKSKRVCVTMTEQDHEHLTQLAYETLRTRSGYLRWLLHRDFTERGVDYRNK